MKQCNPRLAQFRQRKAALLPQITRLVEQGLTGREIGAELGLSKTTVNHWLQKLDQPAAASQGLTNTHDARVARYRAIYRNAMQAWNSSQADRQVHVLEESGDESNPAAKKKKSTRTETRTGDAVLLAKALEALKAIDEIERRQTAADSPERRPIVLSELTIDDVNNLSDEQLVALMARMEKKYGPYKKAADSPAP